MDKNKDNIYNDSDNQFDEKSIETQETIEKMVDQKTIGAMLERANEPIDDEEPTIVDEDEDTRAEAELKKVIKENAREDEEPTSRNFTLAKILGGDILSTQAIRNQVWLILLVAFFTFVYVAMRYSCQKQQIAIAKLNKELENSKYKALSISSELTELSRESNVLEQLKANNDSSLKISSQPPFIVKTED